MITQITVRKTFGSQRLPSVTKDVLSPTMRPQFFMPMNAMKKPIPAGIADFMDIGTELIISCRMRVKVRREKMMPEMSTAAKPACQVNPIGPQTMKEKKALMPRPGATATGKLAQRPMMSVAITVIHTVDTKASPNAMPVLDSMPGTTASR